MVLIKNFHNSNLVEFSKTAKILEKDEEFYLINDWRDNRNPKSLQIIFRENPFLFPNRLDDF